MLIDVNKEGYIDLVMLDNVLKSINKKKEIIVSVMFANNETGIIQPIEKIIIKISNKKLFILLNILISRKIP